MRTLRDPSLLRRQAYIDGTSCNADTCMGRL